MNVSSLPVQLVVYDLVHVRINELNIIAIRIDEMAEFEPIADIHKEAPSPITLSEGHLCV